MKTGLRQFPHRGLALSAAFCSALSQTLPAAEPPPPAGRLLASQCFQCHTNTAGKSGGFESITGKNAAEIIKEMREMKAKAKPGDIMERHSKGYTDEQILQIAAYLATLPKNKGGEDSHEEDGDDD